MGEASQIEVRELTMGYGDRVVQRDLGFSVERGQIFVIMGDSGCGKSTLLRHMVGLNSPRRGDVFLEKLHSGEIFGGQPFVLLSDIAAIGLVIALITGYWLWLVPKMSRPTGDGEAAS